ncbi:histidine phosphatase family protein [Actibacterium sp. 188UL27-1]|uniref:histidine phosphatase family protein n=1 Tax=Actibacterium sp. 188UL27-1 TaxID=2786961 RepID=UPI00195D8753|nr:histidine phosphatase family protein [Actibacterium sp. 188UL27-1]MBM7070373.1 histidine phosphatase family protein [Actibacterium sp. 188UL27-1]
MLLKNFAKIVACTLTLNNAVAQEMGTGRIEQVSRHMGEMSMQMDLSDETNNESQPVQETLRFEPWQMLDDLFRDDVVFLMRHGPTDWSRRDMVNVAPTDCSNQRVMTGEGQEQIRKMGILLAGNGIIPGRIVVSEWCRNHQTLDALIDGISLLDPEFRDRTEIEVNSAANLLLSLQGAPNVTELREMISSWHGDKDGPLMIISHFTNIAELTEFNVYEGEALIVDPDRNNRILGYIRLKSAAPDEGHFDDKVAR